MNAGNAFGSIDRFEEADHAYSFSEQIGERLGLSNLVTQARYNRAYLYFLRGRNMQAVEHFGKLRVFFQENSSHRHAGLCDLDETEIYLQLNLPNDAARLARSAIESFASLNMSYEFAKASAFLGIALTQNRQFGDALQVFRRAQTLFEQENNQYWVALVKLYRAEVLYAVGRLWEARALAATAHDVGVSFVRRFWEPEGILQPSQRTREARPPAHRACAVRVHLEHGLRRRALRHVDRRMWLLDRARPDRDRAILVETALPSERLGLGP